MSGLNLNPTFAEPVPVTQVSIHDAKLIPNARVSSHVTGILFVASR